MPVSGLGVAYSLGGFVLLWSGVKNATIKDTLTAFLKGQAPTANPTGLITVGLDGTSSGGSPSSSSSVLSGGASGGTVAANQAIARALAATYGWSTGNEWASLVKLWDRESEWNNKADNPSSHAYGIPQALPATKMPKSAQPASDGGSSNATAQISWGLSYIKDTYGSPSAAWAHEQSAGWY